MDQSEALIQLQYIDTDLNSYWQMAGFSKFWDGYDNQQVVFIDDPVMPDIKINKEDVQGMKMVLSNRVPVPSK